MSENKSMNDWLKDWDALQRQYFNAWSDLAQKAPFALPCEPTHSGGPVQQLKGGDPVSHSESRKAAIVTWTSAYGVRA